MGEFNIAENSRLKLVRKALKYSQEKFATSIGMTQAGYSEIERGNNAISKKIKLLLASIHKINIDFIEKNEGNMFIAEHNNAQLRDPKDILIESCESEVRRLNAERELHMELLKARESIISAQEKTINTLESMVGSVFNKKG